MDRVDRDLDARKLSEEGEYGPRRVDRHADLDVEEPPDEAALDRVPDREHHRREAQLEIDRCLELAFAADLQDPCRLVEIGPHRLLDHDARPDRRALEHGLMRARRRRDIEHRLVGRQSLVERAEHPHSKRLADASCPFGVEVEHAGDREPALPVSRKMPVDDDRARADRDDRQGDGRARASSAEGMLGQTPCLAPSIASKPLPPAPSQASGDLAILDREAPEVNSAGGGWQSEREGLQRPSDLAGRRTERTPLLVLPARRRFTMPAREGRASLRPRP